MSSLKRIPSTPIEQKNVRHHQRVSSRIASLKAFGDVDLHIRTKNMVGLPANELGLCYYFGWGTPKNKKLAHHYFQLAATAGDIDAIEQLGYMYEHGAGVKSSKLKAAKYYRQVHEQGDQWFWKPKYDGKAGDKSIKVDQDMLQMLKAGPGLASKRRNCFCCCYKKEV